MTKERKICESTIEQFKVFEGWEGGFKTVWRPLEPQPCCGNCKHIGRCGIIFANKVFERTLLTFYCSEWKLMV